MIDVQVDEEIEAGYPELNGCRLQITLANGETRAAYLPNMKGEPEFRMTDSEMRQKFAVLTRALFDESHADRIHELCSQLERLDDIGALTQICGAREALPV